MTTENTLLEKVKYARTHRFITNCYTMNLIEKAETVWSLNDSLMFSYEDHGIKRLIYFAKDWKAVNELIQVIDGGKYYLEYMIKGNSDQLLSEETVLARMNRMVNTDCRSVFEEDSKVLKYRDACSIERAAEKDSAEITGLLWGFFRTEKSHLLYEDEIKEVIKAEKIFIHRNAGHIDALLQADVMPKKFYINQVINTGERKNIHAILLKRLEEYVSCGGKYLFAWVEDTNIASRKFHEKYGMSHDGTTSIIYCIER